MAKTKVLICCLIFLFTLPVLAQEEGIRFFKGSWKKALAEAKQSGKLIFVNVYTDWGVPCQKMEREIFPQKQVGDKYNAHFINYRMNAERAEGESIRRYYRLRRFPTYLYINGNGDLVFMANGYNADPQRFLSLADTVLHRHREKEMELYAPATYESRKQDKDFVMDHLIKLRQFGMPDDTISRVNDQYFSLLTPAELKDPAIIAFLLNSVTSVRSAAFEYIISRQSFYTPIVQQFSKMLGNAVVNSFAKALETNDDPLFWETTLASKKVENPSLRYPYSVFMYTNQYYVKTKKVKRVLEKAPFFLDRVCMMTEEEIMRKDRQQFDELMRPYTSGEMDSTQAWNFEGEKEKWRTVYSTYVARALIVTADIFLQETRNKTELRRACRWAEKAVELDKRNYKYYPVLSQLYKKSGMKREAIAAMQSAITLAQEQKAPSFWVAIYKKALQDL